MPKKPDAIAVLCGIEMAHGQKSSGDRMCVIPSERRFHERETTFLPVRRGSALIGAT